MLSDLSKKNNKSINKIVSNIIENFIYLYPSVNNKNNKTPKDFLELMNSTTINLENEKITREWIHKNDDKDLYR